jgi:hypothetical protein
MDRFNLMVTRYTDYGINKISDVEIFKCNMIVKNHKKEIYHLRLDYNEKSSAWETMVFFLKYVLPQINNKFVLLITGEDITIPNQVDPRWQDEKMLSLIKNLYNSVINNSNLIHCYIENRDEIHEKTSSIPIGINPREMPNQNVDYIMNFMNNYPPINSRELKVISINRPRAGDREIINNYNLTHWKDYVVTLQGYKHESWYKLLQTYPFILCPHGGGIDPSPKVWEALCVGCIPIIKHSSLDDIYINFPIVFVDSWEYNTINLNNLELWREKYSKFYDDPELRKEWVSKLYLNYWENKIRSHF